jgi:hypothetical protein
MQPVAASSIKRINCPSFDKQTGGEKDYAKTGGRNDMSARNAVENFAIRMKREGAVKQDGTGNNTYTGFNDRYEDNGTGLRFMRDSDFFFRTWQGLLHNEDGEPMALVVNPRGYKGAHFASFPIRLVEPMILAGTSEMGVCPACGAPWKRIISKETIHHEKWFGDKQDARHSRGSAGTSYDEPVGYKTDGWQPTCKCGIAPISSDACGLPATVLDPFSGSSATGVACKWHNRNYIGIELNPDYCKLAEQRIKDGK